MQKASVPTTHSGQSIAAYSEGQAVVDCLETAGLSERSEFAQVGRQSTTA